MRASSRLLEEVKQREFLGYAYDGAEASFELLARRALGQVPDYFAVESFRVTVERRAQCAAANSSPCPKAWWS